MRELVLMVGATGRRAPLLARALEARGYPSEIVSPDMVRAAFGRDAAAVVVFDDGEKGSDETIALARQATEHTDAALLVVAAGLDRAAELGDDAAFTVFDADVSTARLVAEIESHHDLIRAGVQGHRHDLLQPFIAAAMEAATLYAGGTLHACGVLRSAPIDVAGQLTGAILLEGGADRVLMVRMPRSDASRLVTQRLALQEPPDDELIHDWLAEFANVVAGQAMGRFVGTPYAFGVSMPWVVDGAAQSALFDAELPYYVVRLEGDMGSLELQLAVPAAGEVRS